MYDLVTLGRKEINWVANIDNYDWILNDESKEERRWKTPFEIYYGRRSNVLVKASLVCLDSNGDEVTSINENWSLRGGALRTYGEKLIFTAQNLTIEW